MARARDRQQWHRGVFVGSSLLCMLILLYGLLSVAKINKVYAQVAVPEICYTVDLFRNPKAESFWISIAEGADLFRVPLIPATVKTAAQLHDFVGGGGLAQTFLPTPTVPGGPSGTLLAFNCYPNANIFAGLSGVDNVTCVSGGDFNLDARLGIWYITGSGAGDLSVCGDAQPDPRTLNLSANEDYLIAAPYRWFSKGMTAGNLLEQLVTPQGARLTRIEPGVAGAGGNEPAFFFWTGTDGNEIPKNFVLRDGEAYELRVLQDSVYIFP